MGQKNITKYMPRRISIPPQGTDRVSLLTFALLSCIPVLYANTRLATKPVSLAKVILQDAGGFVAYCRAEPRMSSILDDIVAYKRREIADAVREFRSASRSAHPKGPCAPRPRFSRCARTHGRRGHHRRGQKGVAFGRSDPAEFDPVAIAHIYEQNGAACISVLTDEPSFQGQLHYLAAIRQEVSLPLLQRFHP